MKKICLIIMGILISIFTFGCEKDKDKLTKITIAEVTHSVFYAPQYVADSLGFFEEEGLKVDFVLTSGADKTMAALLSKDAQIGLMGPEASIYVYQQGSSNYSICFLQLTRKDGSFIMGRNPSDSFELEDLVGHEILGGRVGGVPEMTLEYVLKNAGLSIGRNDQSKDVNIRTDVQFAAMTGAFISGVADYVTVFEPTASNMQNQGQGYILASVGQFTDEIPFTAYSALKGYLSKNSEIIEKFTRAIYKAQIYVQTHSYQEIAVACKKHFTDNTIEELENSMKSYQRIEAWSKNPILLESSFNRLQDIMVLAGELEKKAPYQKIVDTTFAEKAMKSIENVSKNDKR